MISAQDYRNAQSWLAQCERPLLLSHRRPDGDALGALAAMTIALREEGLDPHPVIYEPLPERYALLHDAVEWHRWDQHRAELIGATDAVAIFDTCSWSQLEPIADWLPAAPRTIVIDHHPTRDDVATRPGDLRLVDESAAAVCVLLAEYIQATDIPLRKELAEPLFIGLATDCGWFRFANTDARTLRIAAQLAAADLQPNALFRELYQRDAPARLRLIARMLNSLEMHADNRLAVMQLRREDFTAVGADHSMTDDLVNEAGRLADTEATLLFIEQADGAVRVNLRSKEWLDVGALATRFNGGGHARAAGARPPGDWNTVVSEVTRAMLEALSSR